MKSLKKKSSSAKKKKYGTHAQKIKTLKTAGNIITFKKPFWWKGDPFRQILVQELDIQKGAVRIIGFTRVTAWFNSINELIDAVDWDQMEYWHSP